MNAEQWNALYPVGTPVFAYPGCRPEDDARTRRLVTRTRTKAQLSASGDDVVWVEDEGAYICLTHVDPVSESVWQAAREAEETAAAVAAQGALPMPAGPELSDERLAEIETRVTALDSDRTLPAGTWTASPRDEKSVFPPELAHVVEDVMRTKHSLLRSSVGVFGDERHAEFVAHAREDVPALLLEIRRLKAELAKYVGNEPTIAEEMAYLSGCIDAVRDVCDRAEKQATRWEHPLPVPEWVEVVRKAARGEAAS